MTSISDLLRKGADLFDEGSRIYKDIERLVEHAKNVDPSWARVLGVHPDDGLAAANRAYRTKLHEAGGHPDLGGDDDYTRKLNQAIKEARDYYGSKGK